MPACAQREKEREQERKDEQDLDDPALGTPGGDDEQPGAAPETDSGKGGGRRQ